MTETNTSTALTQTDAYQAARALKRQAAMGGNIDALLNSMTNTLNNEAEKAGVGGSMAFFKFSGRSGEYMIGTEALSEGTHVVFNIMEARNGYVCWVGGKPKKKIVEKVLGGEKPLPDFDTVKREFNFAPPGGAYAAGDGWKEIRSVPVKLANGSDMLLFETESKSGRNAIVALSKAFGDQWKFHTDEDGLPQLPIVSIGSSSFKTDQMTSKAYAPELKIVGWMNGEDFMKLSDTSVEDNYGDAAGEEAERAEARQASEKSVSKAPGGQRYKK
jgi:hypothetical protein